MTFRRSITSPRNTGTDHERSEAAARSRSGSNQNGDCLGATERRRADACGRFFERFTGQRVFQEDRRSVPRDRFSGNGRAYWYLLDDKSDRMLAACGEFERSLGNNPVLIAEAIGWLSTFSPYAKARFQDLHEKARELRRTYQYDVTPPRGWPDRVALLGCGIACFIAIFIFGMGIVFIVTTW